MLCSFSAGDGGDCKRNLKKKDFQEFYFLQLPANLSDILSGGRFVLDTVAPEMTSRELLPIIVIVLIFMLLSSSPHPFVIHFSSST